MDLTLSPEYAAFRDQIANTLKANAHLAPGPEDKGLKHPKRLAWQEFLIFTDHVAVKIYVTPQPGRGVLALCKQVTVSDCIVRVCILQRQVLRTSSSRPGCGAS